MSHHGNDMDDFRRLLMGSGAGQQVRRERAIDLMLKDLGATGRHPDGRMTASDEGGLQMAVTAQDEKVILAFGKEVAWIGFNPSDARALAKSLSDYADEIEREQERQAGLRK